MNLLDIINEELDDNNTYVLEEGLFEVSPMIALFAFKDNLLDKGKTFVKKITDPVKKGIGKGVSETEKVKAKVFGKSGFKDDDTVYKLTKKQREVMVYLYRKYGPDMVNKITDFRKKIMPPYQVIKRNVAKNHSLSNKEVYGMTKEEYYRYRESGRKKIEAKGNIFKDSKEAKNNINISKDSLNKAKQVLDDFEKGKIIDLTATNVEKVLNEIGLGRNKLYGWSDSELEKTASKIREIEGWLNDPNRREENNMVRVFSTRNSRNKNSESRTVLEYQLKSLYEHGISYSSNKVDEEGRKNKGPFKEAFANYLLRREQIDSMKKNLGNGKRFREFYTKILKDAVESASKVYSEKVNKYVDLQSSTELNKMEKKIWGLKITGIKYSGKLDDWYLKIKPEDFMDNTKYYKKPDSVIEAEKEMDKILKQFERELKKEIDSEDLALCKKYRLFNNFLTVKQFKNAKDMFKDDNDLNKLSKKNKSENMTEEEFGELLTNVMYKEYNTIKDLEDEQEKIKKISSKLNLNSSNKEKLSLYLNRKDPNTDSEISKTDRRKISDILEKIKSVDYSNMTDARNDLNELERIEKKFLEDNGEEELKKFKFELSNAKNKIKAYLSSEEEL